MIHPQDEEGFDLTLEEDRGRHMFARNGDHLLIPFQCEICHYRNLKGMDPTGTKADGILLRTIRRANLDAFWSREPGTVSATRRDSLKLAEIGMRLGLKNILPVMGPFPLEDSLGMGLAVGMLIRSLDKGRYQSTLQFESVRKMRSAFSNMWHASKLTLTTSVMAKDTRKTYVTSCPSYSLWFERFIVGMHKRMGDVVHQDKAVTLEVIHKLVEGLEEDYLEGKTYREKEKIADIAVFILGSFLGGLRGEETLRIVLGEAREFLEEGEANGKHSHVVLPLRGRFKGEDGEGYHLVVVSARPTNSSLQLKPWLCRSIAWKANRGLVRGFLFVNDKGRRASLKEFEGEILGRIARVQSCYPRLIMSSIDAQEEYGLSRSFRRGSNSEALNRGVSEAAIDRNNWWRKVDRAGARKAKLPMRDHYTEVLVALKRYLEYSQAL